MLKNIFHRSTNVQESSLTLNDDGTLTYWRENDGFAMVRNGLQGTETTVTVDEAKQRWPQYASKIDDALRELKA